MTPREVDRASIYQLIAVAHGYRKRIEDQGDMINATLEAHADMVRVLRAEIIAAIINYGGMSKPKSPVDPEKLLRRMRDGADMTRDRLRANMERMREYHRENG